MKLQGILSHPDRWTPHHAAEDAAGTPVNHLSAAAVKFSLSGAAAKIADQSFHSTVVKNTQFHCIRKATWEALEKLDERFCVGYSDGVLSEQWAFYDSDCDAGAEAWEATSGRTFDEVHAVAVLADSILAGGVAATVRSAPPAPAQPSPPPPTRNRFTRLQEAMAAVGADYSNISQDQEIYPGFSPRPAKWICAVIRRGLSIVHRQGVSRSEVMESAIEALGRLKKHEDSTL